MGLLFANGGAKKKKSKKNSKKSKTTTLTGSLSAPVDVRSQNSIPAFEDLIGKGPITIILIYADWCGACTRFKENTWNDVVAIPPTQRNINIASVREDMLPLTSISNAKIDGYPSLLLVGKDKKPAEFINESGEATNAVPHNEKQNILTIIKSPIAKNLNTNAPKNLNSKNLLTGNSNNPIVLNQSPLPPNMSADLSMAIDNAEARTKQMGGSCSACQIPMRGGGASTRTQRKGGLYNALLGITQAGLPAALLVTLASKTGRKRTRKQKK